MEKQEDIRITKSKRDLCNALMELMQTVPMAKITVGDICRKAMINRMTFYKHYKDKYDLLNDLLLNVKQSIFTRAEANAAAKSDNKDVGRIFCLVDTVADECLRYKDFLLSVNNDDIVLTMISTTLEKSIAEILREIHKKHPFKYGLEMLSAAITGAVSFLIRKWLAHAPEESKTVFMKNSKEFLYKLFEAKILFE